MSIARVYEAMKKFTDIRAGAREKYLATMRPLADAKGTEYYNRMEKQAAVERLSEVDEARRDCNETLSQLFTAMQEANHRRSFSPPTEEQLRLLQLYLLREKLEYDELQRLANSMNGNAVAMEVVQDIAKKNGILHDFRSEGNEYTISAADEAIRNLADGCRRLMESGAVRGRLMEARRNYERYGTKFNEDDLPQVPQFNTEADFQAYMGYDDKLKDIE